MDETPFLEIDMLDVKEAQFKEYVLLNCEYI